MIKVPVLAHPGKPHGEKTREERARRNPFPGARAFDEDEHDLFHGRNLEIAAVDSLVRAQPLVLLYAPSGAGKSSLINAGLIHGLVEQAEGLDPGAPPPAGTFQVLGVANVHPGGVRKVGGWPRKETVPNIYVTAALNSLGQRKRSKHFTLREYLDHVPQLVDEFGDPLPRLIVFDQFEEILEPFARDDWLECRDDFVRQLDGALNSDPSLHVLIATREDHLATIERLLARMSTRLRARYRMDKLQKDKAREAIAETTNVSGVPIEADALSELVEELGQRRLVDATEPIGRWRRRWMRIRRKQLPDASRKIPDEFVDPGLLSVVCKRLWDRAVNEATSAAGDESPTITLDNVKAAGGVEGALERYYDDAIDSLEKGRRAVRLRRFFTRRLISEHGTRQLVYFEPQSEQNYKIRTTVLDDLREEFGLLRRELRGSNYYLELSHDGFVQPVRNANEAADRNRRDQRNLKLLAGGVFAAIVGFGIFNGLTGDDSVTAEIEVDGDPHDGTFTESSLTGQIVFSADSGDVVTVRMDATSENVDPFVQLFDAEGNPLASDNDRGSGTSALLPAVLLPESGDYRIVASNVLQAPGTYEVAVDSVVAERTPVSLPSTIDGAVAKGGADLYTFTAQAGTLVIAGVGHSDETEVFVDLLDPGRRPMREGLGVETPDRIVEYADTGGEYTVLVSGSGDYELSLEEIPDGELGRTGELAGQADPGTESTAYFVGRGSQVVVIEATAADPDFSGQVRLLDTDGALLSTVFFTGREPGRLIAVLPADGQYHAFVTPSERGGTFELALRRPSATTLGDEAVVEVEQGAYEIFAVDAARGEVTRLEIRREQPDAGGRLDVRIVSSAGVELNQTTTPLDGDADVVFVSPPTASSFVVVEGRQAGDFRIAADAVDLGEIPVLERGATEGEILAPYDDVLFTFEANAEDDISLLMTAGEDRRLDSFLWVWGPDGALVASDDDSGTSDEDEVAARATFSAPVDGRYVVFATGFRGSTGAFVLTLDGG